MIKIDQDLKYELLDRLNTIKGFYRVSSDQYNMRCPLCGDSKKDYNKKRFYIKINPNDDSPIVYCCHNCNSSGLLTSDVLRSMDIIDLSFSSKLTRYNKHAMKTLIKRVGVKYKKLNVKIPHPKATDINMAKKQYILDRLGLSLTAKELVDLKCVFSINDFIKINNIENVSLSKNRLYHIEKDYVGFLTANNEFISFRDITNSNKLRYDKYNIMPELINTVKMYSIPNSIDILSPEPMYINIAEGVFDILGVYFHLRNQTTKNNVYVAVCGSGFINVVKYYMKLGFVGSNIVYNIYSDSDHGLYFYNKVIELLKTWKCKVNIYYNNIGKDYGVPMDDIELTKKYSG